MNVRWSRSSRLDLRAIHDYIARDAPNAADKMVRRIVARGAQLAAFPRSGRVVPEFEIEELRELIEAPYRIIYLIRQNEVLIVTVIHDSRVLRPELLR